MDKIFVDTDIILDLLTEREPHYIYAAKLFANADRKQVKLFISALSFANLNYILSRHYSATQARKLLAKFKTLVSVLEVNDKIIELALASDFKDFEDGVQYHVALENKLKILLTRNLKDYKTATISVMAAHDYIKSQS